MSEDDKKIIYPFLGTMIIFWISYLVIYNILTSITRVYGMELWVSTLIAGISSAGISAAVTLFVSRKSQVAKNTDALNRLITRLGITEEETLVHKISSQYDQIRSDIGRETRGNGSLTSQHETITKEISRNFGTIEKRYEKEDAEYRAFSATQKNLESTMNSFVKDYHQLVADGSVYRQKIYDLERSVETKDKKISELQREIENREQKIKDLKDQINELETELSPPDDISYDDGIDYR